MPTSAQLSAIFTRTDFVCLRIADNTAIAREFKHRSKHHQQVYISFTASSGGLPKVGPLSRHDIEEYISLAILTSTTVVTALWRLSIPQLDTRAEDLSREVPPHHIPTSDVSHKVVQPLVSRRPRPDSLAKHPQWHCQSAYRQETGP